jgi:S1-C subfamily serine protease
MKKQILSTLLLLLLAACTNPTSDTLPAEESSAFESVTAVASSIVRLGILNDEYLVVGSCSGTIIDPRGLILTNFHCIGDTDTGERANPDGLVEVLQTKNYATPPGFVAYAQVVETDRAADLAVLQVVRLPNGTTPTDCLAFPTIPVNTGAVPIEAPVRAVGYPGYGGETLTVTAGQIAGVRSFGEGAAEVSGDNVALKMTAMVGHGNSGGALLNAQNELIGVPFYSYPDEDATAGRMYYAVAASEARDIIAAASARPFPGCESAPAVTLQREIADFPLTAVSGMLTYTPATAAGFAMADATVYLFDGTRDVQSLSLADIQTALVRTTTSDTGRFRVELRRDAYQNALGVVVVYQDRIVVRENAVQLTGEPSPHPDYEHRRLFPAAGDSIAIDTVFQTIDR